MNSIFDLNMLNSEDSANLMDETREILENSGLDKNWLRVINIISERMIN